MVQGGRLTLRDAFALVLAVGFGSYWATFQVSILVEGEPSDLALPGVLALGALAGSCAGATLWRNVAEPMAAVTAGVVAVVLVGMRQGAQGAMELELLHVGAVAGAVVGAVVGAWIGRRTPELTRPILVGCIAIPCAMFFVLALGAVALVARLVVPRRAPPRPPREDW